jgi:aspartyl-tRNA(Asn)/glutamyl-tRNA(Gln) amidotransferase subunit A
MEELGPLSLSISELAPQIKARKISPVEVTQAAIAHAKRMQPILNSFITLDEDGALHQAQEAESHLMRGEYLGPLHGIPIGLKDMLLTKGLRTTDGGKPLESYVPDEDAPVVERLKSAGAIILGKENMHEIGFGFVSDNPWYGRVRNPWDPETFAGGSSGGSAANVAAFVTFASVGTDGGGSVRQPSAVCGIVGLKATYGRVSNRGALEGIDPANFHNGPHTRSVRDCAIMLQAMAGYDPLDPSSVPVPVDDYEGALERSIKGLVMGIPSNHFFDPLDPEIGDAVSKAIAVLEELGAHVREVEMKHMDLLPLIRDANAAGFVAYEPDLRKNRNQFSSDIQHSLLSRQFILAKDMIKAQQARRLFCQEWAEVMQDVDFLITPTTPVLPWTYGSSTVMLGDEEVDVSTTSDGVAGWVMGRNTSPANINGVPALTVPCGFSRSGLPIGMQIMGRPWAESLVLRVAHQYEQAAPAPKRMPSAVAQALPQGVAS